MTQILVVTSGAFQMLQHQLKLQEGLTWGAYGHEGVADLGYDNLVLDVPTGAWVVIQETDRLQPGTVHHLEQLIPA